MSGMQVNSASAASRQAQSAAPAAEKRDTGPDLYEMMRDAREKAEAAREKLNAIKPKPRYGDAWYRNFYGSLIGLSETKQCDFLVGHLGYTHVAVVVVETFRRLSVVVRTFRFHFVAC